MEKVTKYLQQYFPFIHLTPQSTPLVPDLKLWLVDANRLNDQLSYDEMMAILNEPAYWSFCWASGQVLAKWLLDNPDWVAGKRVLDFGAGSGVVAIAAKQAGAAEVIACDVDVISLEVCRENAVLNQVELVYLDDIHGLEEPVDLVVAADVLYAKEHYAFLTLLKEKGSRVLVADSRVKEFPDDSYQWLGSHEATTWPDLNEWEEFNQVRIYCYPGL